MDVYVTGVLDCACVLESQSVCSGVRLSWNVYWYVQNCDVVNESS